MPDAWPVSLPQCFNVPYQEGLADPRIEHQPDVGPPITRRKISATVRQLTGQMKFTRAQVATFRSFFDTTILRGSLPFIFPDPTVLSSTLLVQFMKGSLPRWTQIGGGRYRVDLQLLVLPGFPTAEGEPSLDFSNPDNSQYIPLVFP